MQMKILSVNLQPPKMNESVVIELKKLLTILNQCLTSFFDDFKTLDRNSPKSIMASIAFKLEKMAECARSILKISKALKKESILCLPCVTKSVDEQLPKCQDHPPS